MTASLPTQWLSLNFESVKKKKIKKIKGNQCRIPAHYGKVWACSQEMAEMDTKGKRSWGGTECGSEVGWVEKVRTPGWPGCPRHSPTHLSKASRDTLVTVTRLS